MTGPRCPNCGYTSVLVEMRMPIRVTTAGLELPDIELPPPMPDDFTICDQCEHHGLYVAFDTEDDT